MFFGRQENLNYKAKVFLKVLIFLSANLISDIKLAERSAAYVYQKRAVKTPKFYFLDTGLAAYLTKWNTPDVLKNGTMAGAFFETFVVSEIIKTYYNMFAVFHCLLWRKI